MRAIIGAAILGLTVPLGSGDGDRAGRQVPAALAEVAGVDPYAFARYLAEASVPAGIEMREADRSTRTMRELSLQDGRTISLEDLAEVFNSAHVDYRAEIAGGILHVAPIEGRSPYLDDDARQEQVTVTGLMTVMQVLFAPLDRSLTPGGVRASALARSDVDHGEQARIDLHTVGLTRREVLNAVARSMPGHVWLVTTAGTPPTINQVGFIHSDRSTSEFHVRSSGGRLTTASPPPE
jgi:hypothetical protein